MMHDYKDEDFKGTYTEAPRFAANYKKAGGNIELHLLRKRPEARPLAGHDQDRQHLRIDAGLHRQEAEGLISGDLVSPPRPEERSEGPRLVRLCAKMRYGGTRTTP